MVKQLIMLKSYLFLIAFVSLNVLSAQNKQERLKHYNLEKGLAISGYDPVAYFKNGEAKKGKAACSVSHVGVVYYFASEEHKEFFIKSPANYEPQYGGWCAYAMGDNGKKVAVDPNTFKIINGKLYLFYNAYFNNTLKTWNKDEDALKTKADQNWKRIINTK